MRKTITPDLFIAALILTLAVAIWWVARSPIIVY